MNALDNCTALTQSGRAQNLQMGNDTSGGRLGSFAVSGHGNFFLAIRETVDSPKTSQSYDIGILSHAFVRSTNNI